MGAMTPRVLGEGGVPGPWWEAPWSRGGRPVPPVPAGTRPVRTIVCEAIQGPEAAAATPPTGRRPDRHGPG